MNIKIFSFILIIIAASTLSVTAWRGRSCHRGPRVGLSIGIGAPLVYERPCWPSRYYWGPYAYPVPVYSGPTIHEDVYREPRGPRPGELFDAISRGNLDDVKIIATKINPGITSDARQGKTPLIWAVQHGHIAIIEWLLGQGINVNMQDKNKNTALHIAVEKDNDTVCKMLLQHGALPNVQNKQKQTSLHLAVKKQSTSLINLLMEFGANPTILDSNKRTPIKLAERLKNPELLEALKTQKTVVLNEQESKQALHRVPVEHQKADTRVGSANR